MNDYDNEDPLNTARGIKNGFILSAMLWILIIAVIVALAHFGVI